MNNISHSNWYRISYIKLFFLLVVVLLPFFDNLSGALFKLGIIGDGSIGSPSQVGRLVALGLIAYLITRYSGSNVKRIAFSCFVFIILIEVGAALIHWQFSAFLFGIVFSFKLFFCFFCALFFIDAVASGLLTRSDIEVWLIRYGTIVSLLVLSAYFSGFHIANYSKGIATRGLFISGNGLGVVMGTTTLILIHQLQKFCFIKIVHIFLLLATTALIGTKGSLLFCLISLLYFSFKTFRLAPLLSLVFSSVFAYYLSYPLINIFSSIFQNIIYKFNNIDNKWALLASSRDKFIINAFNDISWDGFNSLRFYFGGGAFFAYKDLSSGADSLRKFIENDIFELFFMYGIFSVFFYLFLYFYVSYQALIHKRYFFFLLMSLCFMHSITVGHVVFNGTSALVLGLTMALSCSPRAIQGNKFEKH
jgi:hypothetical protein